jgi:hypothetical protein
MIPYRWGDRVNPNNRESLGKQSQKIARVLIATPGIDARAGLAPGLRQFYKKKLVN